MSGSCRFLEDELARRYREAAPATLALLQVICSGLLVVCSNESYSREPPAKPYGTLVQTQKAYQLQSLKSMLIIDC